MKTLSPKFVLLTSLLIGSLVSLFAHISFATSSEQNEVNFDLTIQEISDLSGVHKL